MKGKEFVVTFNSPFYKPGDVLYTSEGTELEVVKVYPFRWYNRLLLWFGIPFRSMDLKKK